MRCNPLFCLLICLASTYSAFGQVANTSLVAPAQLGFSGLIYTPSAYLTSWKIVDIGFTHFSKATSFSYEAGESPERAFIANIAFFPFAEVSLKLTRPYSNLIPNATGAQQYYGIGDRSISLRLRVLKETNTRPSIVVGIQDPYFSDLSFFSTNYVVVSKRKSIGTITLNGNLGYGYSDNSEFLHGVFGGLIANWQSFNAMVEYDTSRINFGIGYHLKERFFLQAALVDKKHFSGNVSLRFQLN